MLVPRISSALLVLTAASTVFASTITFGPASFPPIPDGGDLSGSTPGAPVTSQIVIPTGGNLILNPGNAVTITLTGWSHTFISDLVITLTGPGGITKTLMNDDGGGCDFLPGSTYNFNSGNGISLNGSCVGGSQPGGDYATNDSSLSSAWNGVNIDGTTWTLTAQDFFSQDDQPDAAAWSITFDVADANGNAVPEPSTFALLGSALAVGAYFRRRRG